MNVVDYSLVRTANKSPLYQCDVPAFADEFAVVAKAKSDDSPNDKAEKDKHESERSDRKTDVTTRSDPFITYSDSSRGSSLIYGDLSGMGHTKIDDNKGKADASTLVKFSDSEHSSSDKETCVASDCHAGSNQKSDHNETHQNPYNDDPDGGNLITDRFLVSNLYNEAVHRLTDVDTNNPSHEESTDQPSVIYADSVDNSHATYKETPHTSDSQSKGHFTCGGIFAPPASSAKDIPGEVTSPSNTSCPEISIVTSNDTPKSILRAPRKRHQSETGLSPIASDRKQLNGRPIRHAYSDNVGSSEYISNNTSTYRSSSNDLSRKQPEHTYHETVYSRIASRKRAIYQGPSVKVLAHI